MDNPTGLHAGGNHFKVNQLGYLNKVLKHLPLPKDTYHFYCNDVTNILLLTRISYKYIVEMYTDIDNDISLLNDDGTYIKFSYTKRNLYCMYIGREENEQQCFLIQYWAINKKQALAFCSLVIECNILGTC